MGKKNIIIVVSVLIVIAGGSFYGGVLYGKTTPAALDFGDRPNMQNLSDEQRQQFTQNRGLGMPGGIGRNGNNFVSGEILSMDDKSITVKMPDGGSKIVFYSGSTVISKSVNGAPIDLTSGKQVIATGSTNSDGSVTAQNIQIKPEVPN
jgi:hypothetical protein